MKRGQTMLLEELSTDPLIIRARAFATVAATIPQYSTLKIMTVQESRDARRRNLLLWNSRLLWEAANYVRPGLLEAGKAIRLSAAWSVESTSVELGLLCDDPDPEIACVAKRNLRLKQRSIDRECERQRRNKKRKHYRAKSGMNEVQRRVGPRKNLQKDDYVAVLREIAQLVARNIDKAHHFGLMAECRFGAERLQLLVSAEGYERATDVGIRALNETSAAWPWPLLRETSTPSNPDDSYYSSYECPQCFHNGLDMTSSPPPTCQRCGTPIQHWDL
jgi:hypothetical protein